MDLLPSIRLLIPPDMTCQNIYLLSLASRGCPRNHSTPTKCSKGAFTQKPKENRGMRKMSKWFPGPKLGGGQQDGQPEPVSQGSSRVKALFTAVWWKGSKCLPTYALRFLVDPDCDIWRSPCLHTSSGMDWQLRRHRMSELSCKSRGGAV